jgi:hypothetical protein
MGFVKVGDNVPVSGYIDVEGEVAECPECNKPLVVVAVDEDNNVNLVCKCKNPELEQLDA